MLAFLMSSDLLVNGWAPVSQDYYNKSMHFWVMAYELEFNVLYRYMKWYAQGLIMHVSIDWIHPEKSSFTH